MIMLSLKRTHRYCKKEIVAFFNTINGTIFDGVEDGSSNIILMKVSRKI